MRLLLVDAWGDDRALIEACLRREGVERFEVVTAQAATEVQRAVEGGVDCALVVTREPARDLAPVVSALRDGESGMKAPTVALTDDRAVGEAALRMGALDYASVAAGAAGIGRVVAGAVERARLARALREREARLLAADRDRDELIAKLAHELRRPLAPIRTAVAVLRRVDGDAAGRARHEDLIDRQLDHLTRLVDGVLDHARSTNGKLMLRSEVVDLAAVVRDAVETCQAQFDLRRHTLKVSLPREEVLMDGDRTRLTQVVANLLHNAAKYTDDGGRVSVALAREEDNASARISVRDNGRGVDAAALPRLFDPFFQAEHDLSRADGGLGLGLPLVRSLTELHGGTVEARSAGRGMGSEFIVRLPCAPVERADGGDAQRKVLVVDDDLDAAESLAAYLELSGHAVTIAQSGVAAVDKAHRSAPEVVLLDIGMPGMSGYDVCRALRHHGLQQALMIALTGYGRESDRELARAAGFDAHLTKPLRLDVLDGILSRGAP